MRRTLLLLLCINLLVAAALGATAWLASTSSDAVWVGLPIVLALVVAGTFLQLQQHSASEAALRRRIRALRRQLDAGRRAAKLSGEEGAVTTDMRAAFRHQERWVEVELLSAHAHTQAFRCVGGDIVLPVGAEGLIQLRLGDEAASYRVIVARREEIDGGMFYVTRFHDEEREVYVEEPFFRHLTARREPRVQPERSLPVLVDVFFRDRELSGAAIDVSAAGLAVKLPASRAELSALGCEVEVLIDLPEEDDPFSVPGLLRNLQPCSRGVRAGIQLLFDQRDPVMQEQRRRLRAYVEGRRPHSEKVEVIDLQKARQQAQSR